MTIHLRPGSADDHPILAEIWEAYAVNCNDASRA